MGDGPGLGALDVSWEGPMIEEPPKLTMRRPVQRPTGAQIQAFQGVPTGFVVDALGGRGAMDLAIKPLGQGPSIAGPALTAGNGAADIMATLAALNLLQDGDVLVVGFEGFQGCAAVGDRVCGMAKNCGAVAVVTDGPVRDVDGIEGVGMPVWCTGVTPNSPYTQGPGTVGLPVDLAGLRVDTGDMIVADRDGVVVVPFGRIDEVIGRLVDVRTAEEALDAEVAAGLAVPDGVKAWMTDGTAVFVE